MAARFYTGATSKGPLQQGDVFPGIPFPQITLSDFSFIEGGDVRTVDLGRKSISVPSEGVCVLSFEFHWGIVVSQTCDLQPRENKNPWPVTFARVTPYSEAKVITAKTTVSNRILQLQEMVNERGKHPNVFPLAAFAAKSMSFEGGLVALTSLISITNDKLLSRRRRLRLSQLALQSFQERIGGGFLRTALPEKKELNSFLQVSIEGFPVTS